jgi:hypothetical protein
MVPGPSTEDYAPADRAALLDVARASVACGLREGCALEVDPAEYTASLRALRACFVTLRIAGELRGCTGRLEPEFPLVVDVARNAYRSAFGDPRFAPLRADELSDLDYHISVLGPREPLPADSERDLLEKLPLSARAATQGGTPRRALVADAALRALRGSSDSGRASCRRRALGETPGWGPALRRAWTDFRRESRT